MRVMKHHGYNWPWTQQLSPADHRHRHLQNNNAAQWVAETENNSRDAKLDQNQKHNWLNAQEFPILKQLQRKDSPTQDSSAFLKAMTHIKKINIWIYLFTCTVAGFFLLLVQRLVFLRFPAWIVRLIWSFVDNNHTRTIRTRACNVFVPSLIGNNFISTSKSRLEWNEQTANYFSNQQMELMGQKNCGFNSAGSCASCGDGCFQDAVRETIESQEIS